jgi:hypothetical protein
MEGTWEMTESETQMWLWISVHICHIPKSTCFRQAGSHIFQSRCNDTCAKWRNNSSGMVLCKTYINCSEVRGREHVHTFQACSQLKVMKMHLLALPVCPSIHPPALKGYCDLVLKHSRLVLAGCLSIWPAHGISNCSCPIMFQTLKIKPSCEYCDSTTTKSMFHTKPLGVSTDIFETIILL